MKPKTLLVLAVLLAAAGSFVWFYERRLPSSDERAERAKNVVALKSADVNAVDITWDGQQVRLEREPAPVKSEGSPDDPAPPAVWRIAAPLQATADRSAVDRLVESLTGLRKERTLEAADRKELGLETPRAKVDLVTAAGKTTLEIGAELPASTNMAVAVAGEPTAYVVAKSLWTDLTKPPGDWRSKDLFTGTREKIARVSLESGGHKVLFGKRGEEFWLETPVADRADRDAFGRLLSDITGLRAVSFIDEPARSAAEMGLEPAQGVVEVVLEGSSEPFRVELGAEAAPAAVAAPEGQPPAARRYARLGTLIFETDSKLLDSAARPADSWRSLAVSGFEVYRIDKASFGDAAGQVDVERSGPDWKRGKDTISFTTVSDLLYAINSTPALRLAEKKDVTLGAAELTVTLTASDKTAESLSFHPALPNGEVPVTASGREAVLLLPQSVIEDVRAKLDALRKAEPMGETNPPAAAPAPDPNP